MTLKNPGHLKKNKILKEDINIIFIVFLKIFYMLFVVFFLLGHDRIFFNSLVVILASRGSSRPHFRLTMQVGLYDQHFWMHLMEHSQHS